MKAIGRKSGGLGAGEVYVLVFGLGVVSCGLSLAKSSVVQPKRVWILN